MLVFAEDSEVEESADVTAFLCTVPLSCTLESSFSNGENEPDKPESPKRSVILHVRHILLCSM